MSLAEEEIELFFAANTTSTSSGANSRSNNNPRMADVDPTVRVIRRRMLDNALEAFRRSATNVGATDLDQTKSALFCALQDMGLLEQTMALFETRMQRLKASKAALAAKPSYLQKPVYTKELMQEVVSSIFVSSYHCTNDPALLKSCGITHVLSCNGVEPKIAKTAQGKDFTFLTIPAEDNDSYDLSKHFDETFNFIDGARSSISSSSSSEAAGVLIFCGAGISRSPAICAAYLIRKLGLDNADDALDMIQKVRSVSRPNNNFQKQLKEYTQKLRAGTMQQSDDDD